MKKGKEGKGLTEDASDTRVDPRKHRSLLREIFPRSICLSAVALNQKSGNLNSSGKPEEDCAYSSISSVIRFEESIRSLSANSASVCGGSDCLYALRYCVDQINPRTLPTTESVLT